MADSTNSLAPDVFTVDQSTTASSRELLLQLQLTKSEIEQLKQEKNLEQFKNSILQQKCSYFEAELKSKSLLMTKA